MVDQHIHHEEVLDGFEEQKSIYSILAMYLNAAEKHGLYVKGYVDGEENYQSFLREFNAVCRTKFIVRTSWRKIASTLPRKSRYGKEERIYWEYNSGNLEVPFFGNPFVVQSCLTKHCQYGSHYYKSTLERLSKQHSSEQSSPSHSLLKEAPQKEKKRRNKPSKKRECPAIMHIREVVMFPDFGLNQEKMMDLKYHMRQEKSKRLVKLKEALASHKEHGTPLNKVRRFYLSLPLPEVHIGHPSPCGGIGPTFHPAVTEKIDLLLETGIYEARHVRIIVHNFVQEVLLKQNDSRYPYNVVLYPSEHAIADYIYMSSITVKPTIVVEDDGQSKDTDVKGEVEGSISELMNLLQSCQNPHTLAEAKDGMLKVIDTVKSPPSEGQSYPPRKKRKTPSKQTDFDSNAQSNVTHVLIVPMHGPEKDVILNHSRTLPGEENNELQSKTIEDDSLLEFMPDHLDMGLPESNTALDIIQISPHT